MRGDSHLINQLKKTVVSSQSPQPMIEAIKELKKDKMDTIPPVSPTQAILTFENVVKPMKYVESGIFKGEGSVQMDNKEIWFL